MTPQTQKPPHPALSPNSFAATLPCFTECHRANESGERGQNQAIPNAGATVTGAAVAWNPLTEAQWNALTETQWVEMTEKTGTTPRELSAQYDAWNRLVLIANGAKKVCEHVYDARGYRIRRDTHTSGTLTEARRICLTIPETRN